MKLVVQDANIIIDLIDCEIFEIFFGLELEVVTSSLVLDEISDTSQREVCKKAIGKKMLRTIDISTIEYLQLQAMDLPGLKVADRSVLKIAETGQATSTEGRSK